MRPLALILAPLAMASLGHGADAVSSELSPTDRFSKSIQWENGFDSAADAAEPVRCLMRVQHRLTGDPLDWAPAIMLYRLSPHEPLLLRICQPEEKSLENRTEFNYTSADAIPGGKHTFVLEITGSLTKEEGKLRLLMDGNAVTWKHLSVISFPSKQVISERADIGTTISGDAPTLFPAGGRWIVNGDPTQGLFTYTLLAISPL